MRESLLRELHQNHLGVVKMKSIARDYIWWPNIDKDIEKNANNCINCVEQRSMTKKTVLHTWKWPQGPW